MSVYLIYLSDSDRLTGHHRGQPYVSDPRVKEFIRWTKTLKDGAVLDKTLVGGHYCYPPPPPLLPQPPHNGSGEGNFWTRTFRKEVEPSGGV